MDDFDVLLIGGAPGAGKTTLGRALAACWSWASLSGDDLLIAARTLTTPESHPALHRIKRAGHVHYFTAGPEQKLISDSEAQGEAMWPVVERVVSSHVSTKSPAVIDWWLLHPRDVAALRNHRIASVWLHIDPVVLWERERGNSGWMEGSPDPERMLTNFMHRSLWRNDLIAAEAKEAGLPVLQVGGDEPVEGLASRVVEILGGKPAS